MPFFELLHQDKNSHARAGVMHTDHGDIQTPIFMPVGTQATVKTLDSDDLKNIQAQIILGNNYHLHLRPGEDIIAEAGGLHKFMHWDKPILTDSGGFQVFSLGLSQHGTGAQDDNLKNKQARLVSIDEDGVTFTSHIDGSTHRFTPESAIDAEHKIGADIIMAFDECTPDAAPRKYVQEAMERTHRWAKRSLTAHMNNTRYHGYQQYLFGIIQGANDDDLRRTSAEFISSLPFDGIAIGGESIGYNTKATAEILDWVYPIIPETKPHYAMGVGLDPADLLVAVEHGVDMFDCVAPTRLARHGMLFTSPKIKNKKQKSGKNRLNIKNARYVTDFSPIDSWCDCSTCQNYSRGYLHHLFAADEITALRLASIHNLRFMLKLMEEARAAILTDRFLEFKNEWL